jgi:hypothetical protein
MLCTIALMITWCSDDPVGPDEDVQLWLFSAYEINTVDNKPVPHLISIQDTCVELYTGGWLTLGADSTYEMLVDTQHEVYTTQTYVGGSGRVSWGAYTIEGDSIFFWPADPGIDNPFGGSIEQEGAWLRITCRSHEYVLMPLTLGQPITPG